jgi:hypothetical protein
MPWLKPTLWLVAMVFAAFSLWVLMQVGFIGIWQGGFANLGSLQITVDLVIACAIGVGFIARDCRAQGRAWWPWARVDPRRRVDRPLGLFAVAQAMSGQRMTRVVLLVVGAVHLLPLLGVLGTSRVRSCIKCASKSPTCSC